VLFAAALGALALLALPALGIGHDDGDHGPRPAGTIESFDRQTGLLVVDLAKGRKIAGLVVRRTRIRCARGHLRHSARRGAKAARRDRGDKPAPASERGPVGRSEARGDRPGHERDESAPGPVVAPGPVDGPADRGHRPPRCIDALVPGAVVKRAEMVLAYGDAFYKHIGVLPPQAVAPAPEPEDPEGL